jgi:hypothetical protein
MRSLGLALLILAVTAPARAAVVFQNTGNLNGWDRLFTQHQGTNSEVGEPTYKGPTAIKNVQIFEGTGNGRYHAEVETYHAARTGDDHYFGQAMYLPPDWQFHDQNVCVQQWAPDDNSGPWLIMNLNGDHLHWLGGIGTPDLGAVPKGAWVRIVTRIKLAADGVLEVWIDGKKVFSRNGNFTVSGGSIRWSTGLYATRWINQTPTGMKTLTLYHDHLRVATTYEEADPASWSDDGTTIDGGATPSPDAAAAPDAAVTPDAGVSLAPEAAAPAPAPRDAAMTVTPPPSEPEPEPAPTGKARSGGCNFGGAPPGAALWLLAVLLLVRRRARLGAVVILFAAPAAQARFLYSADGKGAPYELLKTPFGLELPDCGHMVPHITEVLDDELHKPVFVFHAHVNQDDDRCRGKDRQRTEIRGHIPELVGIQGATTYYRWKFKLATGFQSSGSFTHIFQLKSEQGAPIMTLTPRSGNLSIDGRVGVRGTTSLDKFMGVWVVADLKILFANAGHIDLTIRKLAGGEVLFSHSGGADTWDDGSGGHDPKWGIYRSLNNRGALRDEQVRFADFCISHDSASDCDDGNAQPPQPAADAGTPGLVVSPDASEPLPPAPIDAAAAPDARTMTTVVPPPEPQPTEPPAPEHRPASSGCSLGGADGVTGLAVLVIALVAWRRRSGQDAHKR